MGLPRGRDAEVNVAKKRLPRSEIWTATTFGKAGAVKKLCGSFRMAASRWPRSRRARAGTECFEDACEDSSDAWAFLS